MYLKKINNKQINILGIAGSIKAELIQYHVIYPAW